MPDIRRYQAETEVEALPDHVPGGDESIAGKNVDSNLAEEKQVGALVAD